MRIKTSYVKKGAKMEWISINDRLPEENGYTLVHVGGMIEVRWYAQYYHDWDKCTSKSRRVTHWMPLPPPPSSHNSN